MVAALRDSRGQKAILVRRDHKGQRRSGHWFQIGFWWKLWHGWEKVTQFESPAWRPSGWWLCERFTFWSEQRISEWKVFEKDAGGNYFDLKGSNIKNGEQYYEGLYGDRDLASKRYVDIQNDRQVIAINNRLSKDGTSQMEGALDMNNNKIINARDTTEQEGDAINYWYFNRKRGVLTGLINNASAKAVQRDRCWTFQLHPGWALVQAPVCRGNATSWGPAVHYLG